MPPAGPVRTRLVARRALILGPRVTTQPDDPVRRFARSVRRAFPSTDDGSATVIAAWMVATFLHGACERLGDDLTRLGYEPGGTPAALRRVSQRTAALATALRAHPGTGDRRHVTASRLDETRRQLRMEATTVSQRVAAVTADDDVARAALRAVVSAAIWLAVHDVRGAVEELCDADGAGDVAPRQMLDEFHSVVASCVTPMPGAVAPSARRWTIAAARERGHLA